MAINCQLQYREAKIIALFKTVKNLLKQKAKKMKYLKLMLLLVVTALSFGSATAQSKRKTGPYLYHGKHYYHRSPYVKNHHTYYRYY